MKIDRFGLQKADKMAKTATRADKKKAHGNRGQKQHKETQIIFVRLSSISPILKRWILEDDESGNFSL